MIRYAFLALAMICCAAGWSFQSGVVGRAKTELRGRSDVAKGFATAGLIAGITTSSLLAPEAAKASMSLPSGFGSGTLISEKVRRSIACGHNK